MAVEQQHDKKNRVVSGKMMARQILTRFDPDKNLPFYDEKSASVWRALAIWVLSMLGQEIGKIQNSTTKSGMKIEKSTQLSNV